MRRERIADLRRQPEGRVQTAAFYEVRDLVPGESVVLLTRGEPGLLMESLNLQLHGVLAWETGRVAGAWRTAVRRRDETAPRDAIDLLARDHRRLDELLAHALRRVNAGDLAGAGPLVAEFARGIRRHIQVESDRLAPRLPAVVSPDGTDHVAIMLREHDEILGQLAELETALATGSPEGWEVEPFMAILSGTLAKHEHREEASLFPRWQAAVDALGAERSAALLAEVSEALQA
jgi:hemerythrin-like domain-containing protein